MTPKERKDKAHHCGPSSASDNRRSALHLSEFTDCGNFLEMQLYHM